MRLFKHSNPAFKTKILDYTYTSEPSINSALPLKVNTVKMVFFVIGCLLSSGFLWLIAKWSAKKKSIFLYDVCDIFSATSFLVEQEDIIGGSLIVRRINKNDVKRRTLAVGFSYHQRTYLYHQQKQVFLPIRYQQLGQQLDRLKKGKYEPYSRRMRKRLFDYYGQNSIDLPIQGKLQIFIEEMLTPYQVFQLYAIILWIYEEYYIFAFLLFGYSLYCYWTYSKQVALNQLKLREQSYFDISCKAIMRAHYLQNNKSLGYEQNDSEEHTIMDEPINFDDIQQEKNSTSGKKMQAKEKCLELDDQIAQKGEKIEEKHEEVSQKNCEKNNMTVGFSGKNSRVNKSQEIQLFDVSSLQILPGDIIILQQGDIIPCDCLLIYGQALVNEQYISGENYLIRKRQIENYTYQKDKEKSFVLYLGTTIVKVRDRISQWNANISQMDSAGFSHRSSLRDNKIWEPKQQEKIHSEQNLYNIDFSEILSPKEVACLVSQTNFNTQRGKFLRAVRYQKKPVLNFTRETIIFLYIIIGITLLGYFIIFPVISQNQSSWNLFIILLDLAGDSIPMTLPAILSMGISFAQHRLSKYGILSVLPSNILAGGLADTLVIDSQKIFGKQLMTSSFTVGRRANGQIGKTYVSVQQFLELSSLSTLSQSFFNDPEIRQKQLTQEQERGKMMLRGFAFCHTLEYYDDKLNGIEEEKSLVEFANASYIRDDQFEVLGEVGRIIERVYFKERDHKFAVIVQILHKKDKGNVMRRNSNPLNGSLLEEDLTHSISKNIGEEIQEKRPSKQLIDDSEVDRKHKKRVMLIKGPPQKIIRICSPETCPVSIDDYIVDMAEKGFHLLCFAYKQVEHEFSCEKDESVLKGDFIFCGLVSLQKQRQDDTLTTIYELKKAKLKIIFISEKRELEATSQAIQNNLCTKNQLLLCSLHQDRVICKGHIQWQSDNNQAVDQFLLESELLIQKSKLSLTSRLYQALFMRRQENAVSAKIFDKAIIFNQMENKYSRNVYFQLQKKGRVSFAVGNGSNVSECAHLSLQLDRGQCSILSSFHTQQKSLKCVTQCLIICRAALATNFHAFSMMVHFSIIQFTTVAILQYHYQAITDSQMLYQDLFVTFPIFITINLTQPVKKLSKQLPPHSFFSVRPLISMIGQLLIQFFVQFIFIKYMLTLNIFKDEFEKAKEIYLQTHQFVQSQVALAMFIITNYLYLGIVLSTSVSEPFRRPFYTNPYYTATLIILWLYNTIIVMVPQLSPGSVRSLSKNNETQQMLVLAMLLGNLVMICMYLFEKLLQWIWQCWWNNKKIKDSKIIEGQEQMVQGIQVGKY